MDQRRSFARPAVLHGALHRGVAGDGIGPVAFFNEEIRKVPQQLGYAAARSLDFDRNRDRVPVVFNQEDDRQFFIAGSVHGFPELAFAGGTVTGRAVDDFVAVEGHVFKLAIIALVLLSCFRVPAEVAACFGASHGLQELRTCRRRPSHDVVLRGCPVRRHLPAAGTGIVRRAYRLQKLVVRSQSQRQTQRAVTIVGIEPVITWLHGQGSRYDQGFMSGARNLEEDLLLVLEYDLAVVEFAGEIHQPVDLHQLLARKAFVGLFRLCGHLCYGSRRFLRLGLYGHGSP